MAISNGKNRTLRRLLRNRHREAAQEPARTEAPAANAPAYSLSASIPERYNDTYVRAIPKDPQNTFVYWEMPQEQNAGNDIADKGAAHTGNGEAARIQEVVNGNGGNHASHGNGGNGGNGGNNGNGGNDCVNRWWYAGGENGNNPWRDGNNPQYENNPGQNNWDNQWHDNNHG